MATMQDVNVQPDGTAPQPTYSEYPAQPQAAPASSHAGSEEEGLTNLGAYKRVFTSPQGICRAVEWLFAVIAFGTMADLTGYDSVSEFKWDVAANVIIWVYVFVMLFTYVLKAQWPSLKHLVELILDGVMFVFAFAAGIAVAKKCDEDVFGKKLCDYTGGDKARASAAFSFLGAFVLCVSAFFSFTRWRNPDTK